MPVAENSLNGRLHSLVTELVVGGVTLEQAKREFERQFILAALRSHSGNLSRSAQALGVHRNTLRNKVTTLAISSDEYQNRVGLRSSARR